jgi:Flp pilus assembly protein TadD
VSLALELQAEPGATWADQIACLDVHQRGAHPNFAVQLGRLQTVAASDPPRVLALVHWMNANGLAERVLEWSRELPAKVTAEPPISGVLAESCLAVKDWGTMRKLVAGGNWGPLEFMRHAFNARLLRADAQAADAGFEWNAALKAAGRQTAALRALARVAESWGMTAEADQVLWGLARGPQEDATWALGRLLQRAQAAGDTHGLFRVLGRLIELHPADDQARNNWAMIAMLLKLDLSRAREMARDLHARHPGDALFASTHAFALHSQGHTADALAVMSSFPEPQLQTPAIAAYHGVFLAAAGKKTEAAKYFRHSEGAKLLPEEQALIAEARKAAL